MPTPTKPSDPSGLPNANPDQVEQELGLAIDNIVPSFGYQQLPMVGLGGSAGSIRALQAFFEEMPPESGMVFVVIMHLSPDHISAMPQMLQKWTKMRVAQAVDGTKVEPNCVYVIPPGKHLMATNGHLKLTDLDREQGRRVAVDLFFRSLADTHGPHSAAVILSGADADGAIGIRRIKERGGLTIAQDPEEAEHGSMPRAAIDSGMVDWVLPVAQMPRRILEYVALEKRLTLPEEDGPPPAVAVRPGQNEPEVALREILLFLRMRTGRDFSYYKRATIVRRISRRMQVNGVTELEHYLGFLRRHPGEAGALLKDLLISVTNFFRDRDAFATLERHIPELFTGKTQGDTIRVWCPACATGEEAYSLAMLLLEFTRTLEAPPAIQVFACDLDEQAIQAGRAGLFPDTIAADVSEDRLRRFFVKEHRGYRVRREVREVVLFATHDLLKDAPFSRLDLVSCRNLLIYLNRQAQERVTDIFHFALKPDGLLFLGSSEAIEEGNPLFRVVDKKSRIYRRKSASRLGLSVSSGPSTMLVRQIEEQAALEHTAEARMQPVVVPPQKFSETASLPMAAARRTGREEERVSLAELHFKLIERFSPPSIVVNGDHDIQHLSESAGRFLEVAGGQPTTNLLRLAHPALRLELRGALYRAAQSSASVDVLNLPIEIEGQPRRVDLRVSPANDLAPDFMLVTFRLHDTAAVSSGAAPVAVAEPMVPHLERELEQAKAHLRDTVEQYEASTEELKASNEELQAMNEELRSATEELETSREELQSINEELSTVNAELKVKVEELGRTNSDLQNLMSATAIATVFLDRDLRIMRFTTSAAPIFNVIPSDMGRPLSDLKPHIDYPAMNDDARSVLETLTPIEREVRGLAGTAYLARLLPYRTIDDHIAGVVLTFLDITERHRARRALDEDFVATERLRLVSERLIREPSDLPALFRDIMAAAIDLTHADSGTVQLFNAETRELQLLATAGLSPDIVAHFSRVDARSATPCGIALARARRAIVDFDAPASAETEESNRWHRSEGLHCAQSTPLLTRRGQPVGMISTHWRQPYQPTERELRFLDLLARQAADAIERAQSDQALRAEMAQLTRAAVVADTTAQGRESRLHALKQEVNDLNDRLGEAPRYPARHGGEAK